MSKPETTSLEDIAADWLLRSDRGLRPAEERELARWLAADARHEAAFLAVEETWAKMGTVQHAEPPARVVAQRPRWRMPLSLAAAATVALGALVGWRTWHTNYAEYQVAARTEVGGLRELELPDGSVVRINTDSQISVAYTRDVRRVELMQGEAHFTVAKNRSRPFIVSAGGVDVRAVGTAFNVRLRAAAVEVLVTEGRVRVGGTPVLPASEPAGNVAEFGAGQRATVSRMAQDLTLPPPAPLVAPVPATVVRQALAWQEKRLDFDGTSLGEMIEEINRYSREKLIIDDPALRAERFGGSFPAGDTDTVVRMLVQNFDVVAEKQGTATTLRLRPKTNP